MSLAKITLSQIKCYVRVTTFKRFSMSFLVTGVSILLALLTARTILVPTYGDTVLLILAGLKEGGVNAKKNTLTTQDINWDWM